MDVGSDKDVMRTPPLRFKVLMVALHGICGVNKKESRLGSLFFTAFFRLTLTAGLNLLGSLREGAPDVVGWGRVRENKALTNVEVAEAPSVTQACHLPLGGRLLRQCQYTRKHHEI